MGKLKDITGNQFGELTVTQFAGFYSFPSGKKTSLWKCLCSCGKEIQTTGKKLRAGQKYCSRQCSAIKHQIIDIKGKRFGNLVALEPVRTTTRNGTPSIKWKCLCDCGERSVVTGADLRAGKTKYCKSTCLLVKRIKIGKEHSRHPLYSIWYDMKRRCNNKRNKSYSRYGGRGISICEKWNDDFQAFKSWAKKNGWSKDCGLQIDRINNNGNYEPDNCRFVIHRTNCLNRNKFKTNSSGYTGVSKRKHLWYSSICIKGKSIFIGSYPTTKEAVKARNQYILDNHLQHEYQIQEI